MSEPFLPVPPEEAAEVRGQRDDEDLEEDRGPDVLPGQGEDDAERAEAAEADQPDRFRTPEPGAGLSAAELEAEVD